MTEICGNKLRVLTTKEHIRQRSEIHMGDTTNKVSVVPIINSESIISYKKIKHNPGIVKLVDELLMNSCDHAYKLSLNKKYNQVKNIYITFGENDIKNSKKHSKYTISIANDGEPIPIEIFEGTDKYIPEMIFTEPYTGTSFDDTKERYFGGKNGIGAKLITYMSADVLIDIYDFNKKLRYLQKYTDQGHNINEPEITECKNETSYTYIQFTIDKTAFKCDMTEDTFTIIKRRAYEISAVLGSAVSVHINDETIPVNTFLDYIKLYNINKFVNHKITNGKMLWDIYVTTQFTKFVSLINGIYVESGTHKKYILDEIKNKIAKQLNIKIASDSNELDLFNANDIKSTVGIFVMASIPSPNFDSQAKVRLTTNVSKMINIPDKFVDEILDLGIREKIQKKYKTKLTKAFKESSKNALLDKSLYSHYEKAELSGKKNNKCYLIITEGISAKTPFIKIRNTKNFGIFAIKGKFKNVQAMSQETMLMNKEIMMIISVIGLDINCDYSNQKDINKLKYSGGLIIAADQDVDGAHIKGLLLNFIRVNWPNLVKSNNFIYEFITPLIKITESRTKSHEFYSQGEYNDFIKLHPKLKNKPTKYYKGLGTSTDAEFKEYGKRFSELINKLYYNNENSFQRIDLAFSKNTELDSKSSDVRKLWMEKCYDPDSRPTVYTDEETKNNLTNRCVIIEDFIDKQLIHYSVDSCIRTIPHLLSGLKESQNKILYTVLDKNIEKEIKVAQLASKVAEFTHYKHGEVSLANAIQLMAQDFCGSNNLPLLVPKGQFGNRVDSSLKALASPRYVFTHMQPYLKLLYVPIDIKILPQRYDEGNLIEPEFLLPVLPTILINRTLGISTGWSTTIPNYNPIHIANYIKTKIINNEQIEIHPWYIDFTGELTYDTNNYRFAGKANMDDNGNITVTELPPLISIEKYKLMIISETKFISKYIDKENIIADNNNDNINIKIKLIDDPQFKDYEDMLEKLCLYDQCSMNNLTALLGVNKIKKFKDVYELLNTFIDIRLKYYQIRKDYIINKYINDIKIILSKINFINMVINKEIKLFKTKKNIVIEQLVKFSNIEEPKFYKVNNNIVDDNIDNQKGFKYLFDIKSGSFCIEKIKKLRDEYNKLIAEYEKISNMAIKQLWINDIDNLINFIKKNIIYYR